MVKTGRQAAATSQWGGDGFILDFHWFGLCELSDTSFSFVFFFLLSMIMIFHNLYIYIIINI